MVKRLLVAALLLSSAGCFDFGNDVAVCHQTGGCSRLEGAGDGGGPTADGGADGGLTPPSCSAFSTSSGWAWEYPLPAGAAFNSLAVLSDDELWATAEDGVLLHLVDGGVTFSRVPETRGLNAVVVLRDGGVRLAAGQSLFTLQSGSWTNAVPFSTADQPFNIATTAVGANGAPWLGGQYQARSGLCAPAGPGIAEFMSTPVCVGPASDDYVTGLDPSGWALASRGQLFARQTGGSWTLVGQESSVGYYNPGAVLELSPGRVLITGRGAAVFDFDGGAPLTQLSFTNAGPDKAWTSLVPLDTNQFFLTGQLGVRRCARATPASCTVEYEELTNQSLVTLAGSPSGSTFYAAGDTGQLLKRNADTSWSPVLPGSLGTLNDLWQDASGELWAVGTPGLVLHRAACQWERVPFSQPVILSSVTRTEEGVLWVAGEKTLAWFDAAHGTFVDATINALGGGELNLNSPVVLLESLSGTAVGNTWATGGKTLLRYTGNFTWTEVALPAKATALKAAWATKAGKAWVVGDGVALFWDGSMLVDRTPPDAGVLTDVWGPSSDEVFLAGAPAFHLLPSGEARVWSTALSPALMTGGGLNPVDGGYVLFAGVGSDVQRAPNGNPNGALFNTHSPHGLAMTRLRLLGGRLYATGVISSPRAYVLSLDAGL